MDLHPIEAAWRRFRNSEHRELFSRARELRQSFLDFIGLKRPPAQIALPGAVAWNLVALREAQARGEQTGSIISIDGSLLVNTIHVWAAYRESKTVFQMDPYLAECLSRSPWPDATPTAALRLPSRCPVLSIPRGAETIHLAAAYDLVTGAEASGALELRISQYEDNLWVPICILHLTRENLSACVEAAAAEARSHGGFDETARLWSNTTAGLALTMLLYLAGEADVVRIVHPGARPAVKSKLERRDPERFRDLREPTYYAVGKEFGRAIERWEIEHRGDPGEATGRAVRPHMRRAHSHLYWTGKGREIPRVRFLLPVSVRGGKLVEEPEQPSETKVR